MSELKIAVKPLTPEAFEPFGDVLEASGEPDAMINNGMCCRYHDLAAMDFTGSGARANISLVHSEPYALPLTLKMVERHPFGSQAFMPLSEEPFLVVVAPDEGGKPGTPSAFLTNGRQGVNYRRNLWHGVLTPLKAAQSFLVVDREGEGTNLEEFFFDEPFVISKQD